jgi:hypothetical protein
LTWRPLTLAERQLAYVWGALALATFALRPLWTVLAPYLRPCVLREITGLPCPTCGATRGALALLEGRFVDAVLLNPLVTVAVTAFLLGGLAEPVWAWRRGTAPTYPIPLPGGSRLAIVAVVLANWAWVIVHA